MLTFVHIGLFHQTVLQNFKLRFAPILIIQFRWQEFIVALKLSGRLSR